MSKETFYFSHDYNTRTDDKIKKLIRKHGMLGYGVYWCIVEDLYNNTNALHLDYGGIAYDLRVDELIIKSIINDFDLFVIDADSFGSSSIENRLNKRAEKSQKARESAQKRWNKIRDNANAMQTQCDSNAIKESKVKENKEKESKEITFPYKENSFLKLWDEWKEYKKKEFGFKYKSIQSEQAALIKLSNLAKDYKEAESIIMQSMENGWKGFFELKLKDNGKFTSRSEQNQSTTNNLLKKMEHQLGEPE